MNHPIIHFSSLPSSNDYLKEHYQELEEGTVIVPLTQTKGKGRLGRVWLDEGKSLLFSLLLKGEEYKSLLHLLPLLSGVALSLALEEKGFTPNIKWPNDVYLRDKKVAGILLEAVTSSTLKAVIIGIGVNVNNDHFDPSIEEKATSLLLEKGKEMDKEEIIISFLHHFDSLLIKQKQGENSFYDYLAQHDYLKGKTLSLNYYSENLEVKALGIELDGSLKVMDKQGNIKFVTSGEATIIHRNKP